MGERVTHGDLEGERCVGWDTVPHLGSTRLHACNDNKNVHLMYRSVLRCTTHNEYNACSILDTACCEEMQADATCMEAKLHGELVCVSVCVCCMAYV